MKNLLILRLEEMKRSGVKALIPFLIAGDPHLAATEKLLAVLAENGADVIELGIPFSDPLADGPVLQLAAGRALVAGTTTSDVFAVVERFRQRFDTPVVLLIYYNLIYRRGVHQFCQDAASAGVSGLVVPDLPFEEAGQLDAAADEAGLVNMRFLSPTTTDNRMEAICQSAKGFIYCVTVTGVTGKRAAMDPAVEKMLKKARAYTDVTLALGFGISDPKQAAAAAVCADAVIVGSALVAEIAEAKSVDEKCAVATAFIRSLKEAIEGSGADAGNKAASG